MDLVMDFLLLAASGTACFYCLVLNRRLKGLTSAKGGLGAGIAALSQSAADVKKAVEGTKMAADAAAARIEGLLAKADEKEARLNDLMDQIADMSASIVNHADGATKKYVDGLAPFIGEANAAAESLIEAIERATAAENAVAAKERLRRKPAIIGGAGDDELEFVVVGDAMKGAAPRSKRARSGAAS